MKFKTTNSSFIFIVIFILSYVVPSRAQVDCDATTLEEFFECYGGTNQFSAHSVAAISTFIQAEDAIKTGDYQEAKSLVENLFETYPKGSSIWWSVTGDKDGANIGSPHAYYGLRMIEDIVDHHLNTPQDVATKTAKIKIVLVGCSKGIQPTTLNEMNSGTGTFVQNNLDQRLVENDYRIVYQSFDFMSRYITSITGGQLNIEVEIVELPDVCMDVAVTKDPLRATGSIQPVWDAFSDTIKEETDWWWILYPSHVPEFPEFDNSAFITGGMGLSQRGGPAFIIDDKWLSRKPAHLGKGAYSDIERRLYLPQWLQHEFFHHLYRLYPELDLEVDGHDWFNINFWPSDFEGQFEADYYAETLHKRLQLACTPLATKLITRVDHAKTEQITKLSIDELLGNYSRDPIDNPWHEADIIQQGNKYYWRNTANVQWEVIPNFEAGRLETTFDTPYPEQDFFIELYRTAEGDYVPGAVALNYGSDVYQKRFGLLRQSVPIEIAIGKYTRDPNSSPEHIGEIRKESGQLFWKDEAGEEWELSPNIEEEMLELNSVEPSEDASFELVIVEEECGLFVLGFKYKDHYYWKDKRDATNASPILINPLDDVQLDVDFMNHFINLDGVFEDAEGDELLYSVTSENNTLVSPEIEENMLTLKGGTPGNTTIRVAAVDHNGGLVSDEFKVTVGEPVATIELDGISVGFFPNPVQDNLFIMGDLTELDMRMYAMDGSIQGGFLLDSNEAQIDLSAYRSGIYFIRVIHKKSGKMILHKIVKY